MWSAIASAVVANHMRNQQAKRQMSFQEQMSNTSYQRAMADMKKAGLNPILAYKQGGASTPAGAMAPVSNVGLESSQQQSNLASAGAQVEQAKKINEEARSVAQTREIQQVVHDERWPRLFSTMSAENVVATALATLSGLDVQQVLSQREINLIDKKSLEQFVAYVQQYQSRIRREGIGLGSVGQDISRSIKDASGEVGWLIRSYLNRAPTGASTTTKGRQK